MKIFFRFTLMVMILSANAPYPETAIVCLNAEEQKLYDLIMEYRTSKKLDRIPVSAKLTRVAQVHAKDLSENYNPDNKNCNIHSWSKKGNWKACCYTPDHKEARCMWNKPREIAGYESNGFEVSYYSSKGASAAQGLAGWKISPGHNAVIVNEGTWKDVKWNAIGIGIYKEYGVVWFGELLDDTKLELCK